MVRDFSWRARRESLHRAYSQGRGCRSWRCMMSADRKNSGKLDRFRPSKAIYWRPFHVSFDDTVELFRLFRSTPGSKHRSHSSKRSWLHLGRSVSLCASSRPIPQPVSKHWRCLCLLTEQREGPPPRPPMSSSQFPRCYSCVPGCRW